MNSHVRSLGLLVLTFSGVLIADEISLKDGRIIDGEVLSQPGDPDVVVQTRVSGISATIRFKNEDVIAIHYGKTDNQRIQEAFAAKCQALTAKDAQSPQGADAWWLLAEEAKRLGDTPAWRKLAQTTLERDPNHAPARLALGYVLQDGKWMKPAEAAALRGEVLFRGKWMPAAQRDAILAEETRVQDEATARATRERELRLAQIELAKREAELRAAQLAAEPAPAPAPQVIYTTNTYASSYGSSWNGSSCGTAWGNPGWNNVTVIRPPLYRPTPVAPCPPSGLQVQAAGQGNGFAWGVSYR
jgi:hypothetical protein